MMGNKKSNGTSILLKKFEIEKSDYVYIYVYPHNIWSSKPNQISLHRRKDPNINHEKIQINYEKICLCHCTSMRVNDLNPNIGKPNKEMSQDLKFPDDKHGEIKSRLTFPSKINNSNNQYPKAYDEKYRSLTTTTRSNSLQIMLPTVSLRLSDTVIIKKERKTNILFDRRREGKY